MKFVEYKYERLNFEEFEVDFLNKVEVFKAAGSFAAQKDVLDELYVIRNDFETMFELAGIRHSVDTRDEYYEGENNYFDEVSPKYEGLVTQLYEALVNSEYRKELEEVYGKQLFDLADVKIKSFSQDVVEDLQEENKLSTEYFKLRALAKIMYKGEERNLEQMVPYMQSVDRAERKEATDLYFEFFAENEDQFDEIYDKLVKVRTRIAKKLGYENYVELGYNKLSRTDYNHKDVANYRKQVYEQLVPIYTSLKKRQKERLGYGELKYYDDSFSFLSGNPTPKGESNWIVDKGIKMYSELSPETKEFFDFMVENDLLELESKAGKRGGGYCTYIPNYKAPYIFSNFNGTAHDITVLTHEAGHAFQAYQSRDKEISEYYFPTLEACEIHSMSMEFLTYPWMKEFFVEDTDKFMFEHLADALSYIPYGVTVDEFQHYVYENPEVSPAERKRKWREIEKKYMPTKNYEGNDYLERGGFWMKQLHIFGMPFYYIDYTLAQVCAFQFYLKALENREEAWKDYVRLCKEGGAKSFLGLLEVAHLENPFVDGTIKKVAEPLIKMLDEFDDQVRR